jgi:hypothetical protein
MMPKRNVYKTKWFAKAARKADIADAELCAAISEVEQGQADDLGGGVWKKRLRLAAFKKFSRDISAYSADAVQHAVETKTWMEVSCG